MNWKLAEAKRRFSELINAAINEPQLIYNQDRLVAAVIEAEVFQEFLTWREGREKAFLSDAFSELRQLSAEEGYNLEIPPCQDRSNPFADVFNDLSV